MKAVPRSIRYLLRRINHNPVRVICLLFVIMSLCFLLSKPLQMFVANTLDELIRKETSQQRASLTEQVSINAKGNDNPSINLNPRRVVHTEYSGPAELSQVLEKNQAKPLSLCSADYDKDGIPDLISGYAGPSESIITLHRGNIDTIYPNSTEAKQRRAEGILTDAPFLSPALVFSVPEQPDFIGSGDFDADGHWDVVVARQGGYKLHLLSGDGQGGFNSTMSIVLPGRVTALTTGEINRRDGLDDVIVGISGEGEAKVLIFQGPQGALKAESEAFKLPAEASSLTLGQLDGESPMDLAVAAKQELIIIRGQDRAGSLSEDSQFDVSQLISKQSFPFAIRSIISGDFAGNYSRVISLLSDDGTIYLASESEAPNQSQKLSLDKRQWKTEFITHILPGEKSQLLRTRMTSMPADTLVALDQKRHQLELLIPSADTPKYTKGDATLFQRTQISLDLEGSPLAMLEMRLNEDALSDLVILESNQSAPTVLTTSAGMVFSVVNTNDSGTGSLRQAIVDSNERPGADLIDFRIPGAGVPSIKPQSPLPAIYDAVTINGTSQASGKVELDGSLAGESYGLLISAGSTSVRGLVINRWGSTAIRLDTYGNNLIEGNYIGTDITGTTALGSRYTGLWADGSSNNTIGGTTRAALNLISGNNLHGIEIKDAVENKVIGNFIGTDINGNNDLGNLGEGVFFYIGARSNMLGGTVHGARNVISGNDGRGVGMYSGASGNSVQGNLIGTNAEGTRAVGNSFNGVNITQAPNNQIGGTITSALNVISGNNENGIAIGIPKDDLSGGINTLVQGNFIGTDVSGAVPLGNRQNGIFIDADSVSNTIEGNRIAFNGRSGVEIPNAANITRSGFRISIISNSIYSNNNLPIDLGPAGVSLNDSLDGDMGANTLQNFPIINSAISLDSSVTIKGMFNSTPDSRFRLQFFHAGSCERCSNVGFCLIPLVIDTREIRTDENGNREFTLTFSLPSGRRGGVVNCTATSLDGNTSEVSPPCVVLCTSNCPPNISAQATSATGTNVSYSMPELTGNCSGWRVTGSPSSGSFFPIGTTPVTCIATDLSGNTATCTFTVTVSSKPKPKIISVSRNGKKLYVNGESFENGAVILINGQSQKTSYDSSNRLIGKKAGKKIQRGNLVQVKTLDGTLSDVFIY